MTISMAALLQSFGIDAEPGWGWQPVRCAWHDDTRASASFNEAECVFVCHACGMRGSARGLLQMIGTPHDRIDVALSGLPPSQGAPKPKRRRTPRLDGTLTAAAHIYSDQLMVSPDAERARKYLQARGFSKDDAWAAMLGYVADPQVGHEPYLGRLAVPYLTAAGACDLRFRSVNGGEPKYLSLTGAPPRLFDARRVLEAGSVVAVCEGEIDALTLSLLCGVPAVGAPGASSWQPHWDRVLYGFDLVLVAGDGDEAGRRFARDVAQRVDGAVEAVMPDGQDVNSMYLSGGRGAVLERLKSLVANTTLAACIGIG